jgi:hypothetical protein
MSGGSSKASPTPRVVPPGGVRLPFFYGWVLVAVAFVTMAVGVNARTAFSLLFPAILDEFGWDRGMAAGVFSFGFLVSALVTPCIGWAMDLRGPRLVIEFGVVAMGAGLILAALVREPWQLYLSLGALVGGGVNCLAYTAAIPSSLPTITGSTSLTQAPVQQARSEAGTQAERDHALDFLPTSLPGFAEPSARDTVPCAAALRAQSVGFEHSRLDIVSGRSAT